MTCVESLEDRTLLSVIQVNSTADNTVAGDGLVTLWEAILAANADTATDLGEMGSGADTIIFSGGDFADATPDVITILSSLPAITDDLTIQGLGADRLTIDAGGAAGVRIFDVISGVSATFSGLKLTGGNSATAPGGSTGAAIRNLGGTVAIVDNLLSNNQSPTRGGAIDNTGTLFISGSTLYQNTADLGGGLSNRLSGTATIINSTFSSNTATEGGGVNQSSTGVLRVVDTTITQNSATGDGGGIFLETGDTLVLHNSIVAENRNLTERSDIAGDAGARVNSQSSFNVIGVNSGVSGISNDFQGNQIGTLANPLDPGLDVLADNGGPTPTHALKSTSPAIDAGDDSRATADGNIGSSALTTDQREMGFSRINGGTVDIGAFETPEPPPIAVVYVDDDFASLNPGDDPPGPAEAFGYDAFASIQEGVAQVAAGGTVLVSAGTYFESVTIAKDLTLAGSGAGTILDADGGVGFDLLDGIGTLTIQDLRITNASTGILDDSVATINSLSLANLIIDSFGQGGLLDGITDLNIILTEGADTARVDDLEIRSTGLAPMAYANLANLNLNGGDGQDTFDIEPIATTKLTIIGGDPAEPASLGDSLIYNGLGTLNLESLDSGTISQTGSNAMTFSQIETWTTGFVSGTNGQFFVSDPADANDGDADDFILRRNPGGGIEVVILDDLGNEQIAFTQDPATLTALTIEGSGDDNTLTVDLANGDPVPVGGLFYDAKGQGINNNGSLILQNGAVLSLVHRFINSSNGSVIIEPAAGVFRTIAYTGLEAITDNLEAAGREFSFSAAADLITLSGAAAGSRVSTTSTSPTVDFANPAGSLTINAGGGDDTITLLPLDSAFAADVIVNGGLGRDIIDLEGATNNAIISYTLNGNEAADTFNISNLPDAGPAIVINGNSPGNFPGDTLNYDGSAAIVPGAVIGSGSLDPDSVSRNIAFTTIETLNVANPPTISISDAGISEETGGPAVLMFTVALSNGFVQPITVQASTLSGSALAGADFTSADEVLIFGPADLNLDGDNNLLTQTFSVAVTPDSLLEAEEEFFVQLTNAVGAAVLDGVGIGTIIDNDSAGLSIDDVTRLESGQFALTVTLSGRASGVVTVEVNTAETASGNQTDAVAGVDFTPISGQILTFSPEGPLTQTVVVEIHDEDLVEKTETFEVRLSNPLLNGTLDADLTIADAIGFVRIVNDDFAALSISDVTQSEGNGPFQFTVTLSKPVAEEVVVRVNTLADTAASFGDFAPVNNLLLTFAPGGPLSQTVSVGIIDDGVVERDERFLVRLDSISVGGISNDPRVTIQKNQGQGTILNNDQATLSIAGDVSAAESEGFIDFSVVLSNPVQGADRISVRLDTIPGTAKGADVDFTTITSQLLTFDFSQPDPDLDRDSNPLTRRVRVAVNDESNNPITENDETFFLLLSDPRFNGVSDPSRAVASEAGKLSTGTILDDDVSMLSISSIQSVEGGAFEFLVALTGTIGEELTVFANTDTGPGAEPAARGADVEHDFIGLSNLPVTFAADGPEIQTQTVAVQVKNDGEIEPVEDFRVLLSNILFAGTSGFGRVMFESSEAVGVILDSEPPIAASFRDVNVSELESKGVIEFTIDLTRADLSDAVTVDVSTMLTNAGFGRDAVANLDFTPLNDFQVSFNPGETSRTVAVQLTQDIIVEPDETFLVRLSNPRVGGMADANRVVLGANTTATGTIVNDDIARLTIADAVVTEGDIGSQTMQFTVTLSAPVQGGLTVPYLTKGATAAEGVDFLPLSPLSFTGNLANETRMINVSIIGDTLTERDETFEVELGTPVLVQTAIDPSAIAVQDGLAKGTVLNDDSILAASAGDGGGPHIRVFDQLGNVLFNFFAYEGGFTGGVRVATGDVTGDGTPDIITAPGPGMRPLVRVFDGTTGLLVPGMEFEAYHTNFLSGVFVAVADLNGDNIADIITSPDEGGGPHVRAFSGADLSELFQFMAYDPRFLGGVRIASGDVTGDGIPDLITGPGRGGGPHVRVFNLATAEGRMGKDASLTDGLASGSFFAFDPDFIQGIFVAVADFGGARGPVGTRHADIIVSKSFGGSEVRIYDGLTLDRKEIETFPNFMGGVRVGTVERVGNARPDLVAAAGAGGGPHIKVYDGETVLGSAALPVLGNQLFAFDPAFLGGVFIAGSTLDPIAGSPLRRAGGPGISAATLTSAELNPIVSAALVRLQESGLDPSASAELAQVSFVILDLGQDLLGLAEGGVVFIDEDASGLGWFIDPTPFADEEFQATPFAGREATDGEALGRVDLLTVVLHELGHALGLEDLPADHAGNLMAETLAPGVRRLPDEETWAEVFGQGELMDSLLLANSHP